MMKRLQSFDFNRSPYQRVSDQWVCGYAAEGRPCRLGPTAKGRCQSQGECEPRHDGKEWLCTRSEELGGACEEGPGRDGRCCNQRPPCVPQASLRRKRGKVTFWATALTVAVVALVLGTQLRDRAFDPGPVIQGHGEVGDCGTCHVAFDGGPAAWLKAAVRPDDPHGDSKKCVACHDRGRHSTHPHNLSPAVLEQHSKTITANTPQSRPSWMIALRDSVFDLPKVAEDALACATCHKEHLGAQFDATEVADARCQTCHAVKFSSFSEGHPPFDRYPYLRRTRLAFDHESHFNRNFAESKVKNPPQTCAACHVPDSSGRYMEVKPFNETCVACHRKDIQGEGLAGTKGIPVFALPELDLETLQEKKIDVGQWPEYAIAPNLSPFMVMMLSGQPGLEIDLALVQRLELADLTAAKEGELRAVQRIAWAVKDLLYDIVVTGAETVRARVELSLNRNLEADIAAQIIAQIPLDVMRAAQRDWFPALKQEVEEQRQKRAALELLKPRKRTAFSFRRFSLPPLVPGAPGGAQLAAASEQDRLGAPPTSDGRAPGALQLAQNSDDLLSDEKLVDKKSLRLEDFEELLKEESSGDNSDLGTIDQPAAGAPAKEEAAAEPAKGAPPPPGAEARPGIDEAPRKSAPVQRAQPEAPAAAPQPAAPAAAPAEAPAAAPAPRVATGGGDDLLSDEKLVDKKSLRLEDFEQLLKEDSSGDNTGIGAIAPSGGGGGAPAAPAPAADQDAPAVAAPQEAPAEEVDPEPEVAAPYEPLDPEVDPETWAGFGGWFRQDFIIYYRPVTHRDPFMRAWIDLAAKAHGTRAEPGGRALMAVFRDKATPGKCTRCHSQDERPAGGLKVNWRPYYPVQSFRPFTVFNHSFHFSLVGTKGCGTCHELQPGADFAGGYKDLNPQTFQSNFAPMKVDVCTECHVEESAGEACVQCHRFHVGEFPIIPVRTVIADMTAVPAGQAGEQAGSGGVGTLGGGGLGLLSPPSANGAAPSNGALAPQAPPQAAPLPNPQLTPPAAAGSRSQSAVRPNPSAVVPPALPPRKLRQGAALQSPQPSPQQAIQIFLSSHRTPQEAEIERRRLLSAFNELLTGRQVFVDRQDQGDRGSFYRLVAASFPNWAAAETTCQALQARRQDCRVLSEN